jgi:hypothetical protein
MSSSVEASSPATPVLPAMLTRTQPVSHTRACTRHTEVAPPRGLLRRSTPAVRAVKAAAVHLARHAAHTHLGACVRSAGAGAPQVRPHASPPRRSLSTSDARGRATTKCNDRRALFPRTRSSPPHPALSAESPWLSDPSGGSGAHGWGWCAWRTRSAWPWCSRRSSAR